MTISVNNRPGIILKENHHYDVVISSITGATRSYTCAYVKRVSRHGADTTYWIDCDGSTKIVVDCQPNDPRIANRPDIFRLLSVNGQSQQIVDNRPKTISSNINDL